MMLYAVIFVLFILLLICGALLYKLQSKNSALKDRDVKRQLYEKDYEAALKDQSAAESALAAAQSGKALAREKENEAEAALLAAQRQCGLTAPLSAEDFTHWLRKLEDAAKAQGEYQLCATEHAAIFTQAAELRQALQQTNDALPFFSGDSGDFKALVEAAEARLAEFAAQQQKITQAEARLQEAEEENTALRQQAAATDTAYKEAEAAWQALLGARFHGRLPADLTEQHIAILTELQPLKFGAEKLRRDLAALNGDKARQKQKFAELPAGKAALAAALPPAQADLTDAENRYRAAVETRTRSEQALKSLTGSDEVAELEQSKQTLALEIEDAAQRYLRLSFGLKLAEAALLRYRDAHRGGMMEATESAFSALTRGTYQKLKTQKEGNREILLALDKNGVAKRAEDMSKGTRFQLYMALRAAAYQQLLNQNISLPFFCDDIFETFDEERTEAACRLMQYIGESGQAIYFTHHRHVTEIAKQICGDNVQIHSID